MKVEASVTTSLQPEEAWRRLVDWPRHSDWIPLTRVWVTRESGGVGTRFVGRTGLGPLAFDDPMEVTRFEQPGAGRPGLCEVVKQGRVVTGTAGFEVVSDGQGSRVTWFEDIEIWPRPLFRLLAPLVAPVAAGQLRPVLTKALKA